MFKFHTFCFLTLYLVISSSKSFAQPIFNTGQDPKPNCQDWVMVETLSDEFDGTTLDEDKWLNTDPVAWVGRPPGLFIKEAASVGDGSLQLTGSKFDTPREVKGATYTHGCGNIWSKNRAKVGYYFETRMKANKTFLSSTFWLINRNNELTGCEKRTTELDIQECVGQVTGNNSSFDKSIHSNTHSRNVECPEQFPSGSEGGNASTSNLVWQDFHIYGCWWKSPKEVIIFLDGQEVYRIEPKANFDIEMYLRLVTETYNWNPVPTDGGMTGTISERTTFYDWVRTWKLAPSCNITNEKATLTNPPTELSAKTSYSFKVDYEAKEMRDVVVSLLKNGNSIGEGRTTVSLGKASTNVKLELSEMPKAGTDYEIKTSIRPVGGDESTDLNSEVSIFRLTIITSLEDSGQHDMITIYPNPANDQITISGLKSGISWRLIDIQSRELKKGSKNKIELSGMPKGIYFIELSNGKKLRFVKQR